MSKAIRRLRALWRDRTAATAIEYGLIGAMISLGIIAALDVMGDVTKHTFSGAAQHMSEGRNLAN